MKKYLIVLFLLVILLGVTGCKSNKYALEFKEEYESINNQDNGYKNRHRELSISEDNPFVYSTAEEISKKMDDKETFIVYFGFKECPWCRSVLTELIKVAKDKEVETIYYVDVKDIRDVKEVDEEGNITTTKEGSKGYMELLEKMDSVLENYTLTKDEEKIDAGEKRIYAPNIVAVANGEAIQLETGISEKQTDGYQKLTDKMKKETYNKFKCLINCLEEESTTCKKDMC